MKLKKILSVGMFGVMLFTTAFAGVGCGGGGAGLEQIDSNRTQLYVANYDGGHGHAWLDQLKADFEAQYATTSFEADKTGVQIIVSNEKDVYHTNSIKETIDTSEQEVYFASGDNLDEFMANNALLEITDIVTAKIPGEDKSIEDKILPEQLNHFKRDGKYYSLPGSSSMLGLVYDVDLFDENSYYLAKDGSYTNLSGDLSAGPDGDINTTYDNGLPATYDEFFALCAKMADDNVTPISWAGTTAYINFLYRALWADYEGLDKASVEYNAGTKEGKNVIDIISGWNGDEPIITPYTMDDMANYKEVLKQPGRYYALDFIDKIEDGGYYYTKSTNINQSHIMAQADFLDGKFTTTKHQRIAMLIEGDWWENEAIDAGTFKDLETEYGAEASASNRRFAFLPLPKQSADKAGKATVYTSTSGSTFINANIKESKITLAKTFLQYCHTDSAMNIYTKYSGGKKSFNYTITDETKAGLSYFSKSFLEMLDNSDVVMPYFSSLTVSQAIKTTQSNIESNMSTINGTSYNKFFNTLKENKNITAKDYFDGLYEYNK